MTRLNDRFDRLVAPMVAARHLVRETERQPLQHQKRNRAHVPAMLKLPEMLRDNVNVGR